MTESAPHERVELIDEEFVAERGPVRVRWLVRHNDGWIPASRCEGARAERLAAGPRVVWRQRIELELARGTRLSRVETRAAPRSGSTLDHLLGSPRSVRARTLRIQYRVGPRGVLVPEPERTK